MKHSDIFLKYTTSEEMYDIIIKSLLLISLIWYISNATY